jgi:hypothetical protein
VASNIVKFSANSVSWGSAVFTTAGGLIYDSTAAGGAPYPAVVTVYFGQSYVVTGGTFTINWSPTGIMSIAGG